MGVGDPDSPLSQAAQPQTLSDLGALAIPSTRGAGATAALTHLGNTAKTYTRGPVLRAIASETLLVDRGMRAYDKVQKIRSMAAANQGGTLVKAAETPSLDEALTSALSDVRQTPSEPITAGKGIITTPPQPSLPPGYTPRSSVPQMTDIAPVKLTGKIVATAPNAVSPASVLKPTILDPEVADTPRDWTSSAIDPMLKNRMQAAHKDIMFDDARYRMGTADTAAQLRANPQSVKDALLALLNAPK